MSHFLKIILKIKCLVLSFAKLKKKKSSNNHINLLKMSSNYEYNRVVNQSETNSSTRSILNILFFYLFVCMFFFTTVSSKTRVIVTYYCSSLFIFHITYRGGWGGGSQMIHYTLCTYTHMQLCTMYSIMQVILSFNIRV